MFNLPGSAFLKTFGIEQPIILAPMAGGPGTPELAAAVANAGGMGSLGCAYQTAEQAATTIRRTRELTSKPINVNLFAGGFDGNAQIDPQPMLAILAEVHRELALEPPTLPAAPANRFREQLDVVLEARPEVSSFTFGIPAAKEISRLRSRGILVLGTATTMAEARLLQQAGVDGIVAQGAEAGAHRGTFATPFEASMVPTLELVRQIRATASVPVIASGGLMDGRDIRRALEAGAAAVQLGTAFLASPECGASPAYKNAVLNAKSDTTVITRAFSGRPARGLRNEFIARLEGREAAILPFPLQNALTRAMRTAAAIRGVAGFLSLWAGQGVTRARCLPAGELVRKLVEEMG
jgi:nitronate monooxygenase